MFIINVPTCFQFATSKKHWASRLTPLDVHLFGLQEEQEGDESWLKDINSNWWSESHIFCQKTNVFCFTICHEMFCMYVWHVMFGVVQYCFFAQWNDMQSVGTRLYYQPLSFDSKITQMKLIRDC